MTVPAPTLARRKPRAPSGRAPRRRGLRSHPAAAPYLFILPFFLLFRPFGAGAVVIALLLSFADWKIGAAPEFAGIDNYSEVLGDELFRTSLGNTAWMLVAYIAILLPLGIAVAVGLSAKKLKGRRGFQVALFLPIAASLVTVALVFQILYDDNIGLFNGVLESVGLPPIPFLTDPAIAPWSIIALRVWRVVGYYAVILFAGIQTIPEDLYEAAEVDGAGPWMRFWHITLPLLRPVTLFVAIAASIGAWELFAEPAILTDGGPLRSTTTAVMYIYKTSFLEFDLGKGAAAAAVLAGCVLVTTLVLNFALRSKTK